MSIQKRAKQRRDSITYTKVALHSKKHHSFHLSLDTKSAWELLAKLSQEAWIEQTGFMASNRIDKSQYRFISGA